MMAAIKEFRSPTNGEGENKAAKPSTAHVHLKEWRKHRRFTLEELATKVNRSLSLVSAWESGARIMNMMDLQELARVYGVHPSALLLPPEDSPRADLKLAAGETIEDMDVEAALQWLQLGRKLPRSRT
jgi:transcriptional regulator with XRE-family HTH domain